MTAKKKPTHIHKKEEPVKLKTSAPLPPEPEPEPTPEVWDYEIFNIDWLRSASRYWVVNDALIRQEIAELKDQANIPGVRVFKR